MNVYTRRTIRPAGYKWNIKQGRNDNWVDKLFIALCIYGDDIYERLNSSRQEYQLAQYRYDMSAAQLI